ncbi:hypothetical protein ACFL6B_03210 [Thermodesulfobacteriota bacterium]
MAILSRLFHKLRSFFEQPPHDYIPSTMPFLQLNIEKIKKDMGLVKIGKRRGKRNEPSSASTTFDDIEQKIVSAIESEKKRSHQIYIDSLKTYSDRLRSLDFETRISSIEQFSRNAIAEFRAQVHNGVDQLYQLRRHVIEIGREEEDFRKKHNLNRTAHFPDSTKLHYGIIAVLLLVESLLNGNFLARGSELGLLGGVLDALGIAMFNVWIGFLVGKLVMSQMFHSQAGNKIVGYIGTLSFICLSFVFNIMVAHYRDALGGELPEKAAMLAIESFLNDSFNIVDFKSWMMVLIGFSFSIVAAIDGFRTDDPYPGYGQIAKRRIRATQEYADMKEDLMEDLREIKEDAVQAMTQAKEGVEKRKNEYHSILDARERLNGLFQTHLEYLESCANNLLSDYREANRHARSSAPPSHYSELWELEHPPPANIGHTGGISGDEINRANSLLTNHMQEVFNDYEKAVDKYKQIEQLP